jgi:hypothetical protein
LNSGLPAYGAGTLYWSHTSSPYLLANLNEDIGPDLSLMAVSGFRVRAVLATQSEMRIFLM